MTKSSFHPQHTDWNLIRGFIAVVEHGRVAEQGTHEELIALGHRYRTMYELQASRFLAPGRSEPELDERGEAIAHETL